MWRSSSFYDAEAQALVMLVEFFASDVSLFEDKNRARSREKMLSSIFLF